MTPLGHYKGVPIYPDHNVALTSEDGTSVLCWFDESGRMMGLSPRIIVHPMRWPALERILRLEGYRE